MFWTKKEKCYNITPKEKSYFLFKGKLKRIWPMRHDEVPRKTKRLICESFAFLDPGLGHAFTLIKFGIDPDPKNELIWRWFAEARNNRLKKIEPEKPK